MNEQGFWDLFWATGLPEAWLGTRLQAEEQREVSCFQPPEEPDPV